MRHLEVQRPAGRDPRVDQILHHFVLPVDRNGLAAAQLLQVDVVTLAAKTEVQPLMRQAFALQPFAHAHLDHQIDGALLQHPGAHALDHILLAAVFNDDRIDALQVQQVSQQQAGGPGADDANLCMHV